MKRRELEEALREVFYPNGDDLLKETSLPRVVSMACEKIFILQLESKLKSCSIIREAAYQLHYGPGFIKFDD